MFQHMKKFRSDYQNRLRRYAELLLIPGLTPKEVKDIKNAESRKNSLKFQTLLGLDASAPEGSIRRYSIVPPLLSEPNPAPNDDLQGLFQSPIIKRACISSIFVPISTFP
jgi:hypothetical protein